MTSILSIQNDLKDRIRARRKEAKITQSEMANRSGVSLGTIKWFETTGKISLTHLLKIAFVLGYENDFENLFARKNYQSIDEVINAK
jgi:transcriptional regulator with XRE-family HTH domain